MPPPVSGNYIDFDKIDKEQVSCGDVAALTGIDYTKDVYLSHASAHPFVVMCAIKGEIPMMPNLFVPYYKEKEHWWSGKEKGWYEIPVQPLRFLD